ncbi:MAG: hypothetical protein J6A61_03405, partial [Clostridia bacterium]|nr:hypothetical protein [Clostridia bacterium]
PTYRCGGYRDDCNNKALNIKYIDDFVVTKLMEIVFDKRNYTYILEALNRKIEKTAYDNKNKMIKVKNRLVQVETSLNKLTKALLEAENLSAITSKIAEIEKEKEKFEKKIAELETYEPVFFKKNDIDDVKAKFKSYLLNKDLLVCRKFIRSYVDRIVVCDDCIEVILKTKDENLKNAA